MKNQYGICEWYLAVPGPAAIKTAALLGYDGIQISDLQGHLNNFPLNDPRIQSLYLEAAEETGIIMQAFLPGTSVMSHGGICHPLNSTKGEEVRDNFRKSLEVCTAMKIPTLIIPGLDRSRINNDYQYMNTCRMLKLFIEEAGEKGIVIAYESFLPVDRLLHMLDFLKGKLKITYDTLNPIRYGFGRPSLEIKMLGADIIDHVHVKDAYENMEGTCPLGTGAGNLEETVSTLRSSGYSGWYIAENFYYLPPMSDMGYGWDLAKADLEYMRSICE